MNLLFIIVLVLLVCNVVNGCKIGMVRQLISLVSLVVLCIVAVLIGNGLRSYSSGNFLNVILMAVLLCLLGIAHHLLGLVLFPAKIISKLPIVSWLDKLLGIVFGVLETVLILWTVYTFVMMMDLGTIGEYILKDTAGNGILTWFYQHNHLARWVEHFIEEFKFSQLIIN